MHLLSGNCCVQTSSTAKQLSNTDLDYYYVSLHFTPFCITTPHPILDARLGEPLAFISG